MAAIVEGTRFDYRYRKASGAFPVGTLLMEENGGFSGTVFIVDYAGNLRKFKTGQQFLGMGYNDAQIQRVPMREINSYIDVKPATFITDSDPLVLTAPAEIITTQNENIPEALKTTPEAADEVAKKSGISKYFIIGLALVVAGYVYFKYLRKKT